MEKKRNLREEVDSSRLMTKLSVIGGIGAAVLGVLVLTLGILKNFACSDTFALAVIPYTLAALFAFACVIYGLMSTAATREEEEKRLLEQRKENSAFNVEEDVRFTAGRSFANYKKFAPYVLAVMAALLTGIFIYLFARYWGVRVKKAMPDSSQHVAFVAGIFMFISVFAGAFFVGQSRDKTFRWMSPLGAWLICGSMVMLLAGITSILNGWGYPGADYYVSRVMMVIFGILGAEFIVAFVVEFYRPRTLEEPRPVFESRLLALFTEPGGVMRNIAATLDYQFGFKVSGTWVYRFVEKALFPMLIVWLLILWVFTCIKEVGPNEVGVEEHFGRIVSRKLLKPNIYFTLPYPFGKIARYSCSKIYRVTVGPKMIDKDGKLMRPKVVLWTKEHFAKESRFLVAVKQNYESKKAGKKLEANNSYGEVADSGSSVSVSFLGATIPVQYRIREKGLINFAYNFRDGARVLKKISEMEAVRYLASVDFMDVMAHGRGTAAATLKSRIQKSADKIRLGVDIVEVTILDAHPPVKEVAPAFQDVIGAMETKSAEILRAKAYREKVLPQIESEETRKLEDARSYKNRVTKVAEAEAERFNKQLTAYLVMPYMYKLRTYLSLLEKDAKDIRKFIVSGTLPYEVYELNFEQKQRLDLIDADLDSITKK
ncbi:SPFH domain-containing protein [Lentisphaerota bacterium ZTH]|nr:hypothetical protein JYG24_07880 [Lentisphaerota bacterium]WET06586.1 SPFH domain-containing protein [Lentisphaerota bacterium ZTH]